MSDWKQESRMIVEAEQGKAEALVKLAEAENDKILVQLSRVDPNRLVVFRYGLAAWIVSHITAWIIL